MQINAFWLMLGALGVYTIFYRYYSAFVATRVAVLDDAHAVTNEESINSIEYGLEHLPANAHAVVITRIDPRELREADFCDRLAASIKAADVSARQLLLKLPAAAFAHADSNGAVVDVATRSPLAKYSTFAMGLANSLVDAASSTMPGAMK